MDFHFAIVSDRSGGHGRGVFKKAMLQRNLLRPEFVMCVGDLIQGDTDNFDILKREHDEMDTILNTPEMRFFRPGRSGSHSTSSAVAIQAPMSA